jgi:hypothetical protein
MEFVSSYIRTFQRKQDKSKGKAGYIGHRIKNKQWKKYGRLQNGKNYRF